MRTKALVGVGAASVVGIALLLALPAYLPGLLDLTSERLAPPPELHLLAPLDGEGVGSNVTLAGQALSTAQAIADVQYRIDGGRWQSAPLTARGQRSTPFEASVPVPPGDHVLEARAFDGDSLSLVARVEVRRDAPSVRILEPADGAGLASGPSTVSGVVRGVVSTVRLEVDGVARDVDVVAGAWTARVDLAPGEHALRATALGRPSSLPHEVRVAAGETPPPTLVLASPRDGSAYGATGDLACGGGCILVTGTADRADRVRVDIDGAFAGEAPVALGAWSYRVPMVGLASGAHQLSVRATGADGAESVPRNLTFLARTSLELAIVGDDAPQETGTPLRFEAVGEDATDARWTLDGAPAGVGASIEIGLAAPGDHVLSVQTGAPRGRAASASIALHAVNRAPSLSFHADPALVEGETRFAVVASDPDGRVASYVWDFGDGTTHTGQLPTARHRYAERGAYTVSVTAVDDLGAAATAEATALVDNAAPALAFAWEPERPTVLDVVRIVDASRDFDGRIAQRSWTLPDGNVTLVAEPTLRLRTVGPHTITLRATDDEGLSSLLTHTIEVANLPPVVSFLRDPALPVAHEDVLFVDASHDVDGSLRSWRWDFGDGASSTGQNAVHAFAEAGTYLLRLTVTDDLGAVATLEENVTVLASPPIVRAVRIDPPEPATQDVVSFEVLADDRDADVVAASWDFGDGATSDALAPSHRYARSGAYAANVTVQDAAGLSFTFPFRVHVANAPPVAALATEGDLFAAYPARLVAEAGDPDGRIVYYTFDADGDGRADCEGVEPICVHVYETSGTFAARLRVEDDEGATATSEAIVDVALPPADHPPPTVRVESPARGATLRGETLVRGVAEGPRDVVRVELQLRAGDWAYAGGREPWRVAIGGDVWRSLLDTTRYPDGDYDLVVRAIDDAGGAGFARVPIRLENGERASEVTLQLVDAPDVVEDDAIIRASAFHPEGVTSVRWRIDADDWTSETENPLAFTIDIDRDALKPGSHLLQVEAYHGVHEKATTTHPFTVPGVAPVLVIDVHPNTVAHALLHAEGRIVGEGRVQWRIDQGLWRDLPPGSPWNLTADTLDVEGGRHVLSLRAVSPDGRLASETKTWKIDVINPPFTASEQQDSAPRPGRADVPSPALAPLAAVVAALALARRRAR